MKISIIRPNSDGSSKWVLIPIKVEKAEHADVKCNQCHKNAVYIFKVQSSPKWKTINFICSDHGKKFDSLKCEFCDKSAFHDIGNLKEGLIILSCKSEECINKAIKKGKDASTND